MNPLFIPCVLVNGVPHVRTGTMLRAMQPTTTESNSPPSSLLTRARVIALLPFLIVLIGLGMRLYGLDWDQGNFYHPDERSIYLRVDCMYRTLTEASGWQSCINRDFPVDEPGLPSIGTFFDADTSPLNPHWFPLGSILLYGLLIARMGLGLFMDTVGLHDMAMAGRTITAFVDTGSVIMLLLLGRRLYGRGVGLLASALGAFAVVNIQLAHFYRPEPFLVLLALTGFWYMHNVIERGRWRDHLGLGIAIGLSFAVKASSVQLLAPLAVTYGLIMWRAYAANRSAGFTGANRHILGRSLGAGAVALAVFTITQPYAFLDIYKFIGDLVWEGGVAKDAGRVPYTIQYIGAPRGWYEIRQTALWGLGLPLGIVAWTGLVLTMWRSRHRPLTGDLLFITWVIPSLLLVFAFEVKFLRYIAPVLPVMVLLGSRWLMAAFQRTVTSHRLLPRRAVTGVIAFVVLATAFYALAFTASYGTDHPGVQASNWVKETVPEGTAIVTDNHWDEGFPDLGSYRVSQLPMYEGDTLTKMRSVAQNLASAEYLMAYSNRPFGSIARQPERFPWSSSYYKLLFNGSLGFELAQTFARYPTLLGVSFTHDPFTRAEVAKPESLPGIQPATLSLDLGYADENVTNYDRPLVLVFQNTGKFTDGELYSLIVENATAGTTQGLLFTNGEWATQQGGGTWTDLFDENGWTNRIPIFVWLLLVEAIMLVTLPLAVTAFRWLPDRGVVLARPLGILLVGYLAWLGASVGWWTFSQRSIVGVLLIVALVSGLLFLAKRSDFMALARAHWRYLATVETLFLLGFFIFVAIRAANPDLWHAWRGGEKPMDFTYLTAIVKSTTMPPYDPWYAGGYINYYYFGLYLMATLIKVTGIVPAVAYNLAIPLLFAITLTASFSIAFNLAESFRQRSYPHLSVKGPLFAGAAAAMMVVVLGNLDGAAQLVQGVWRWSNGEGFPAFDFWRSSRLMPGQIAITEFPFWTFLFADLHAHLIVIPFSLLALGLALNVVLGAGQGGWLGKRLNFLFLALGIGALAAINAWEVPTYWGIGVAAGGIAILTQVRRPQWSHLRNWLIWSALLIGLAYLLFLPFHSAYDAPAGGLKLSQWRTVFWHYMGIHGLMFVIVGSWLAVEWYRKGTPWRQMRPSGPSVASVEEFQGKRYWPISPTIIAVVLAVIFATGMALAGWGTVGVLLVFLLVTGTLVGWWVINRERPDAPVNLFMLLMALLALGIGVGVDFITMGNDIDRMNTVFKFYLQAWVLFSILSGVALWHLWASGAIHWHGPHILGSRAWLGFIALLIICTGVYPILGTRARLADRFQVTPLTLNGAAYQAGAIYTDPGPSNQGTDPNAQFSLVDDAAALAFMRENITGSPVALEAVTNQYRWTPRVAKYTGLPVVVGWEFHQTQQRNKYQGEVRQRTRDVNRMYTTTSESHFMALIRQYQVAYIYVGPVERLYYSEDGIPVEGMGKFDDMLGSELSLFYESPAVRIYQVVESTTGAPSTLQDGNVGASIIAGQEPGAKGMIENFRDIVFILFSGLGILTILIILFITYALYRKVKGLIDSVQGTLENIRDLTETAMDDVAKPLAGSASAWSLIGGVLGLMTGFSKRRKRRDDKDKDRKRRDDKDKDRKRR
jgi:YYY domain-containing protein